jgi:hypothetical protein
MADKRGMVDSLKMTDYTKGASATFILPEESEWSCYMFGGDESGGFRFRPCKGNEPNWFWRWTQWIVFGNRWVKG